MRRLLLLSILMTVMTAYARQISPQEAASVASDFLNTSGLSTRSAGEPVRVANPENNSQQQPYYVFNAADDNGFVIVSGDDRFSKILGYSDRGSFSFKNMPPQLKALLNQFAENATKSGNWNGTHPSWNAAGFSTRADEGVLLETADWGQDAPYNAGTPIFEDQHAPTGCVATAMAIVMKYHKWPETYNWDAMPMKIEQDEENPPAPNPELARLMKDAGEAVFMSYGPMESGANMNWVGHRLQQVFKYSPDCQFISAANFSNDKWLELLKGNIDNGNPVIYQGTNDDYTQNHAFVLDGYNSAGYHINWGWDGWYNGYYALDALTPNELQDFSCNNGMVINIAPDKSGFIYSDAFVDNGYFYGGRGGLLDPILISVENVKQGEVFHIANQTATFYKEFAGEYGIALVSKDNKIKEVLKTQYMPAEDPSHPFPFRGHTIHFTNLTVKSAIDPTDRLQLVTKKDGENDFRLMLGTLEHASSLPVVGNKPEFVNVDISVGPGVFFEYYLYDYQDREKLPEGTYSLKNILKNLNFYYTCGPEKEEKGKTVILNLEGEYIYGANQNYRIDKGVFSTWATLYSDYKVSAKVYDLEEKNLTLDKAGTLADKLANVEKNTLCGLTISGKMNAIDFWYLRDYCPALESLDIRNVTIEAVTANDNSMTQFDRHPDNPANTIPEFALASLSHLETLILPDNLTAIADNAFTSMNLAAITIPAGVTSIGLNALYGNRQMKAVCLLNPEPIHINDCVLEDTQCPDFGMLFVPKGSLDKYKAAPIWKDFSTITEGTIPDKVNFEAEKDGVLYSCFINTAVVKGVTGKVDIKVLDIPEKFTVEGMEITVTGVGDNAFSQNLSIESVVLPNSVVEIGNEAFQFCKNLKNVTLSPNLRRIGHYAFANCENLRECNLGDKLELIEYNAFQSAGIEKIYLNKIVKPDFLSSSPFGLNPNLKEIVVHPENESFELIDGVLYRKSDGNLWLECIPTTKEGTMILPENCVGIISMRIGMENNITEWIFNKECMNIPTDAIFSNYSIRTLTLPKNAIVQPRAFFMKGLESIIFTGNLKKRENIFEGTDNLKYIIIDSPDETVELDGIFDQPKEIINIFSSSPTKNFSYSDNCVVFVPGQCTDNFAGTRASTVYELWRYNINRKDKKLEVVPQFENLVKIDKVTINGKVVTPQNDIYPIDDTDNIDVKVEYTLLDRQKATTHYSAQFNNEVKDAVVTGMQEIFNNDSALMDVYTTDGILSKKGCSNEDLKDLRPGIYIIRQGSKTRKVVITK